MLHDAVHDHVVQLYKSGFAGWNVAHFHTKYMAECVGARSYSWLKTVLQGAGVGADASQIACIAVEGPVGVGAVGCHAHKAGVVLGPVRGHPSVGGLDRADPGQPQCLDQTILQCLKRTLHPYLGQGE